MLRVGRRGQDDHRGGDRVRAAEAGRRAVVLTIDPARRLAQSMGLSQLDNTPAPIGGIDQARGGSLDAMMLDMKRTFDEIVEAHAEPERARAILANPFYQALSSSFAGTQEYMAMEKLGQLHAEVRGRRTWDLIVVDTPPSRSALDFLDAPKRLGSFLDGRLIRILAAPARGAGRAYVAGDVGQPRGLHERPDQDHRYPGAARPADVRRLFRCPLRRISGTGRGHHALLSARGTRFLVIAARSPTPFARRSYFVERLA